MPPTKKSNASMVFSLTYRQVRKECINVGLSPNGSIDELRQRLLEFQETHPAVATAPPAKRKRKNKKAKKTRTEDAPPPKKAKKSIAADLTCPITLELPFDPVTAEDGRVYERAAIEQYFQTKRGAKIKSPMTNLLMGKKLIPALTIKNLIETSMENGDIEGDLANKWNERAQQKALVARVLKQAEQGDVAAMEDAGCSYEMGNDGFEQNEEKAFFWYDKARAQGSIRGMTEVAFMLLTGKGVAKDEKQGLVYLCLAAHKGSDWAAYHLGKSLANGQYDLKADRDEAVYWLQKCLFPCSLEYMTREGKDKARDTLKELLDHAN
jgi:U-box domain/Sel1 repeat